MSFDISNPQIIGGIISTIIFGVMFIVSTWRLFGAALGWYDTLHRFFNHKIIFHTVYSLYTLLEALYAVSLILHQTIAQWGYTLHIIALLLNLALFLMLINVWGILLHDEKKTRNVAFLLISVNLVSMLWAIIDLHSSDGIADFLTNPAYMVLVCANGFAMFTLCILIMIYGYQLQETLRVSPKLLDSMTEEEISIKLLLLRRIKVVLLVSKRSHSSDLPATVQSFFQHCIGLTSILLHSTQVFTVCYFCRVFTLLVIIIGDNTVGSGANYVLTMPGLLWFLISWWLPNILPVGYFLNTHVLSLGGGM